MNAISTVSTPRTPTAAAPRRRPALRFFRRYDDPPGVDSHALPSEIALRPIEPHHLMRR